jgi:hypothetical protein
LLRLYIENFGNVVFGENMMATVDSFTKAQPL